MLPGCQELPGSPFAAFEATEAWKERRQLDEAWRKAENPLESGLQAFQEERTQRFRAALCAGFYPFSGPDALTMTLCFPRVLPT